MTFKAGNNGVVFNIKNTENTGCAALFGKKRESVFDRFLCVAVEAGFSVKSNGSALSGADSEDAFKGFASAGTKNN